MSRLSLFSGILISFTVIVIVGYWVRYLTSKSLPLPPYTELVDNRSIERTELFLANNLKVVFVVDSNLIIVFDGNPDSYSMAVCGKQCLEIFIGNRAFKISNVQSRIYIVKEESYGYAAIPERFAVDTLLQYKKDRLRTPSQAIEGVRTAIEQLE